MDIDKLKLRAGAMDAGLGAELRQLFGRPDEIGQDVGDITTELLKDTLRLTHPDIHPPERHDLATRVTRELRALEPYVFPAPELPKPIPPTASDRPTRPADAPLPSVAPPYPCEVCKSTFSYYYCTACRTEWEHRRNTDRERRAAHRRERQRAWYRVRKDRQRRLLCYRQPQGSAVRGASA